MGRDTHTQVQQDNQEVQGKSYETTLGQSDPNIISSTLSHVGPTMGGVWQGSISQVESVEMAAGQIGLAHSVRIFIERESKLLAWHTA